MNINVTNTRPFLDLNGSPSDMELRSHENSPTKQEPKLQKSKQNFKSMSNEVRKLNNELIKSLLKQLTYDKDNVKLQLQLSEAKRKELESCYACLREKKDDWENSKNDLEKRVSDLSAVLDQKITDKKDLKKRKREDAETIESLTKKLKTTEEQFAVIKVSIFKENLDLKDKLKRSEEKLAAIKESSSREYKDLKNRLRRAEENAADFQVQLDKTQHILANEQKNYNALSKIHDKEVQEMKDLKVQLKDVQEAYTQESTKNETLQKQNLASLEYVKAKSVEIIDARKKIEELEKKNEGLNKNFLKAKILCQEAANL